MTTTLRKVFLTALAPSKSNPRGKSFRGPEFEELVASVRAQGVLVPILVRPTKTPGRFEIVAGHRRVAAARRAGLREIAAAVREMGDLEAREAQIVENLQRADVHPLDEAQAFRFLAERRGAEVPDIAARVGKSESFVRDRLALVGLAPKVAKAFRDGDIELGAAIALAKVDVPAIQLELLEHAKHGPLAALRRSITRRMYEHYGSRPWAKDEKLSELLGDTKRATLFGDADDVADPAAHARRMAAYIEHEVRRLEAKGETVVRVSTSYGQSQIRGVLSRDQYVVLSSKAERESATEDVAAVVVEGYEDQGKVLRVSTAPADLRRSGAAPHALTDAERAARKREREKADAKRAAEQERLRGLFDKVTHPLTEGQVDGLFAGLLARAGSEMLKPIAQRHGVKPEIDAEGVYKIATFQKPLERHFAALGAAGKMRLVYEAIYEFCAWHEPSVKAILKPLR